MISFKKVQPLEKFCYELQEILEPVKTFSDQEVTIAASSDDTAFCGVSTELHSHLLCIKLQRCYTIKVQQQWWKMGTFLLIVEFVNHSPSPLLLLG